MLVVANISKETKTITAITFKPENKLNPFKKTKKSAYGGEILQTLSIPPYTQIGYDLPGLKEEGWEKLDFVWFIDEYKCKISQS